MSDVSTTLNVLATDTKDLANKVADLSVQAAAKAKALASDALVTEDEKKAAAAAVAAKNAVVAKAQDLVNQAHALISNFRL
jgi:hypothetical protein